MCSIGLRAVHLVLVAWLRVLLAPSPKRPCPRPRPRPPPHRQVPEPAAALPRPPAHLLRRLPDAGGARGRAAAAGSSGSSSSGGARRTSSPSCGRAGNACCSAQPAGCPCGVWLPGPCAGGGGSDRGGGGAPRSHVDRAAGCGSATLHRRLCSGGPRAAVCRGAAGTVRVPAQPGRPPLMWRCGDAGGARQAAAGWAEQQRRALPRLACFWLSSPSPSSRNKLPPCENACTRSPAVTLSPAVPPWVAFAIALYQRSAAHSRVSRWAPRLDPSSLPRALPRCLPCKTAPNRSLWHRGSIPWRQRDPRTTAHGP